MSLDLESRAFGAARPASPLERMLQDPIIRLVMASDGVDEAEIRTLAGRVMTRTQPFPAPRGALCAGCA